MAAHDWSNTGAAAASIPKEELESGGYSTKTANGVSVTLINDALWSMFDKEINEMILTRVGRRMFPVLKIQVGGLKPQSMYSIMLHFSQLDDHKWKYLGGQWLQGTKAEPTPEQEIHSHQNSPNFGSFWMRNVISFDKVKMTNKLAQDLYPEPPVVLNSLHRYQPVIEIVEIGNSEEERKTVGTFTFEQTKFIAVTAYQNKDVTHLKVSHNPFAKAFQESEGKEVDDEFSNAELALLESNSPEEDQWRNGNGRDNGNGGNRDGNGNFYNWSYAQPPLSNVNGGPYQNHGHTYYNAHYGNTGSGHQQRYGQDFQQQRKTELQPQGAEGNSERELKAFQPSARQELHQELRQRWQHQRGQELERQREQAMQQQMFHETQRHQIRQQSLQQPPPEDHVWTAQRVPQNPDMAQYLTERAFSLHPPTSPNMSNNNDQLNIESLNTNLNSFNWGGH